MNVVLAAAAAAAVQVGAYCYCVYVSRGRYAGLIVDHLESMEPDGEAETASAITGPKKLTFCVEGNISVGKTTFLKKISDCIELQVTANDKVLLPQTNDRTTAPPARASLN